MFLLLFMLQLYWLFIIQKKKIEKLQVCNVDINQSYYHSFVVYQLKRYAKNHKDYTIVLNIKQKNLHIIEYECNTTAQIQSHCDPFNCIMACLNTYGGILHHP